MVNSVIQAELLKELERLSETNQKLVLGYARSLPPLQRPQGTKGSELLKFAGSLSPEDAEEMRAAIEEGCERIDTDGW